MDKELVELLVRHITWQTKAIVDMSRLIAGLARAQRMSAELDAQLVRLLRGRHDDGEEWKR